MSEQLVGTIISACIAGVFSLIGKRMELAGGSGGIDFGLVVIYVGILQLVWKFFAAILVLAWLTLGASPDGFLLAQWIVGTFVGIVSFLVVGLQFDRATMWTHLILIALGSGVIVYLINSWLLHIPLSGGGFIYTLGQAFISMGIGGTIAYNMGR